MLKDKLRDPVCGLTHLGAAILALFGLIALIILAWGESAKLTSLIVYGISLILMFAASATYHMTISSPKVISILRKVDHSAIYLLIAGTYTPFCINNFSGFWKWGLLAIIWSLAIIGVGIKVFIINAPRWVNAGVYLIMGWLVISAMQEMLNTLPAVALTWLIVGGVIYTFGAIIYITKKLDFVPGVFGFHEVWHIFVILAATAHYISILSIV
ncbi:MAG: hemolysin III family protein [Anaerolineae bacterium]|jgi:hemolysin III|nr:hemolysin III family protein [Anaerolineae bacterium]MBT7070052.1 hemolysin III family protein [Anaerolineae bacterium]MBT7323609.1 hemolysin III family protein [Anaerolineae bacterium]